MTDKAKGRDRVAQIIYDTVNGALRDFDVPEEAFLNDPEVWTACTATADAVLEALSARLAEVEAERDAANADVQRLIYQVDQFEAFEGAVHEGATRLWAATCEKARSVRNDAMARWAARAALTDAQEGRG